MATYNMKANPAFAGYDFAEERGSTSGIHRLLRNFSLWLEERRAYRQAVFELNQLSDRDLADIGIARCDIESIALQTAKAKSADR